MKLVFDYRMFQHINETALKEHGHASRIMLGIEQMLRNNLICFFLAIFEHSVSFILRLPIPFYSGLIYFLVTNMRGSPSFLGMYFRALYWRGKLGKMEPNVLIDQNVFFAHPKSVYLSEFCYIDKYVIIMSNTARIGRRVHLAPRVFISGGGDFEIEDHACIATNANIITATEVLQGGGRCSGPMTKPEQRNVYRGWVHIKKDAFIAAGVTIVPGVTIGEGSVIGAGVTVYRDTDPWGVYLDSPPKRAPNRDPVSWPDV